MKIIISPAKKMNVDTDTFPCAGSPAYLDKTAQLLEFMRGLSLSRCQKIWKCNDSLAQQNYQRFQTMDLHRCLTPAVISYEGLQYQYMAPAVLDQEALEYIQKHVRILSGFYGVLRPFDGVVPYRLEMQSRLGGESLDSLYEFWGTLPFEDLMEEGEQMVLNLASKEYSKIVEMGWKKLGGKKAFSDFQMVTCIFGEEAGGKVKEKGTYAKMARGEMVRFLAEHRIENLEGVKAFDRMKYQYSEAYSSEGQLVFLRKPEKTEAEW